MGSYEHWCGIGVLTIPNFGKDGKFSGRRIIDVGPSLPAQKAGLLNGDIVKMTREQGGRWRPIDSSGDDMRGPVGSVVDLRIERDGRELEVTGLARAGVSSVGTGMVASGQTCDLMISDLGSLAVTSLRGPSRPQQR